MVRVIGVDIGGTFTDAFLGDDAGSTLSVKVPSTPPDFGRGFLAAIDELAKKRGIPPENGLADVSYICHGTTSTLNALLTGDVANVGLITTQGHRDSIFIMNLEGRYAGLGLEAVQDVYNQRKPPPLIPKRMAKEVTERIDYEGKVVVKLEEENARDIITDLIAEKVDAIAVSLLWSFKNTVHERRIRVIIHGIDPKLYVCLSSDLVPKIREYSRTVTTVMNAQVAPTLRDYLRPLEQKLEERGFKGPLLIMQGSGGSIASTDAPDVAISTIGSVLTGGIVGAGIMADRLGHRNVITTDVGGTTMLVGLIVDGKPEFTHTTTLNQFRLNIPMINVNSIGSGGGAIAWLDDAKNIRVGPNSAGANPGPACFDKGGTKPTVTDANLVLGILNPNYFADGTIPLRNDLAEEALRNRVGKPLGLTLEEAAAAVFEIQNAQTSDKVRSVIMGAGHDPRDFVMYAFGGGGPVHCHAYGAELGIQEIFIPLGVGASSFSAYGLTAADVVLSREVSDPENLPLNAEKVQAHFEALERKLHAQLMEQGVTFESISYHREVDIKYSMQIYEVPVPMKEGQLSLQDMEELVSDFERTYQARYGSGTSYGEAGFQAISYRVFATGHVPFTPTWVAHDQPEGAFMERACKGTRKVHLDSRFGWEDTLIIDYNSLAAGDSFDGPAIVEVPSTTIVVPRGAVATTDEFANVRLNLEN